jgi:hypothetical protein
MTEAYYRKTAALVGALFIIATATSLASALLQDSALDGPDYLLKIADFKTNIMMAAMLDTILAISVLGIGALMYPVLRRHAAGLANAYAGIRTMEAVFIVAATVCLLGMLSLGQDYAAGRLDVASSRSLGAMLSSLRDMSLLFGTLLFLSFGGLVLNYLLYRSRLVPRWLSIWGLIGGVGILIYGTLGVFGTNAAAFDATALLAAPIAVQEMVFASWLILKGFGAPGVAQ